MKTNRLEKTAIYVLISLGIIFAVWIGISYTDLIINGTDVSAYNIFHRLLS